MTITRSLTCAGAAALALAAAAFEQAQTAPAADGRAEARVAASMSARGPSPWQDKEQ
jgi:hypothetical protein